MNWKASAPVAMSLLALAVVGLLGFKPLRDALLNRAADPPAVVTQIQRLQQLVTVRYRIQRIVSLTEPKVPFGSESILLMVEGQVLAGVDLASISARNVSLRNSHQVTVTLPAPRLYDTFLEEKQTKVWDRQITWWTPWVPYDPDLEHKARLKAIEDIRAAALEMGILDNAERNAETAIRDFLAGFQLQTEFSKGAGGS